MRFSSNKMCFIFLFLALIVLCVSAFIAPAAYKIIGNVHGWPVGSVDVPFVGRMSPNPAVRSYIPGDIQRVPLFWLSGCAISVAFAAFAGIMALIVKFGKSRRRVFLIAAVVVVVLIVVALIALPNAFVLDEYTLSGALSGNEMADDSTHRFVIGWV